MDEFLADLPVPHSDGSLISPRIDRVIELIQEYDHNIDVRWIPRDKREPGDAAFALVARQPDGREYVAMYVQTEEEFDERVIGRLHAADNNKDSVISAVEAQNAAARELQRKRYEEALQESHELAAAIWKSPKSTYKHDGKVYR